MLANFSSEWLEVSHLERPRLHHATCPSRNMKRRPCGRRRVMIKPWKHLLLSNVCSTAVHLPFQRPRQKTQRFSKLTVFYRALEWFHLAILALHPSMYVRRRHAVRRTKLVAEGGCAAEKLCARTHRERMPADAGKCVQSAQPIFLLSGSCQCQSPDCLVERFCYARSGHMLGQKKCLE